jgi:drug/metabolite transporter (DMT)-like permease
MPHNLFYSQILAILTVLLWSSAYVFTKIAMQYYYSSSLALLRCAIASICLGGVLIVQRKSFPGVASLPSFLISGAVGFALYLLVFNKGSEALNPTTSCIIIATSPIMTALLARVCFGEKLGGLRWVATGMAFCGILVMTLWNGVLLISDGIYWMLTAALLISIHNILQRSLGKKFEPLIVTAYSFFAGAILLTPFFNGAAEQILNAPPTLMWLVIFLGACPSALAYLCWAKALSLAPGTSNVSNYMFLTPFLALLLEYIVTMDLPSVPTFVGGGIIMTSLAVFLWASRKAGNGPV